VLLLALLIQVNAEVSIKVLGIKTVLTQYGLNATYRSELVNISLIVLTDKTIYNVSINDITGAYLVRSDTLNEVLSKGIINATIKIPDNASLGVNYLIAHVIYYTLPKSSEVCGINESTITLYACVETNVSTSSNILLYVYTYPYMDKKLVVFKDGEVVLNTTIYSWKYYEVPGPGTYLVTVTSIIGNASIKLVSKYVTPLRHGVTVWIPVTVIPRNVTSLSIMIDTNGNSVIVANTLNSTGQLIIRNIKVGIYSGIIDGSSLRWVHNKTYLIPKLALGESKVLTLPWDLRSNPLINVTAYVCDDIHGYFKVNETFLGPLIQGCKHIVFRVMDSEGNPLSGALISLGNASVRTDHEGRASLEVYPVGKALVKYDSKIVYVDVLGCGEYDVVFDLNPPRLLSINNPKPGVLSIRAIDETAMYVWVNGLGPFGPFNNSITLYLPSMRSELIDVVIKDSFNNSVSNTLNFRPLSAGSIDYVWLGKISVVTVTLLFLAFTLITRLE